MAIHIISSEGLTVDEARQIFEVGEQLRPLIDRPCPEFGAKKFFSEQILPRLNSLTRLPAGEGHLGRNLEPAEVDWIERQFLEDYNSFDSTAALRLSEEINRSWLADYPRVYVQANGLEASVIVALHGPDGEYLWKILLRADSAAELTNAVGHSAVEIIAIVVKIVLLVLAIAGLKGGGTAGAIAKAMVTNPKIMEIVKKIIELLKGGAFTFATIAELLMDLIMLMAGDKEIWAALKGLIGGYFKVLGWIARLLGRLAPGVGMALTIASIGGPLLSLLSELGVPIPAWLLAVMGQDPSSNKPPAPPEPKEPCHGEAGGAGTQAGKGYSTPEGRGGELKNLLPGGRTQVSPQW